VTQAYNQSTWGAEGGRLKFKASLGYIVRPYLLREKQTNKHFWKNNFGWTRIGIPIDLRFYKFPAIPVVASERAPY
jgi:hypothetical protein